MGQRRVCTKGMQTVVTLFHLRRHHNHIFDVNKGTRHPRKSIQLAVKNEISIQLFMINALGAAKNSFANYWLLMILLFIIFIASMAHVWIWYTAATVKIRSSPRSAWSKWWRIHSALWINVYNNLLRLMGCRWCWRENQDESNEDEWITNAATRRLTIRNEIKENCVLNSSHTMTI